ncbi:ABC transporter permease [Roseivirga thermotolerans]|uniref:ABC transporter permease n=1 Tax=Roseivirga thermotolerans TaxID=1758176 RepID=UPI00273E7B14|nr:ABC transporter permease [Roseivirga thermotolerans]
MNNRPPKYFTRLLTWFCHDDFYEELQGDLEEKFYSNIQQYGQRKARTQYRLEVLKLLRPSVAKKLRVQTQNNNIAMFKNYTLVAFRNLSRNRLFSAINIFGLAMSMAVGLLAIAFVNEIYSFDQFHENKDRIYRINNVRTFLDNAPQAYASTSLLTADRIRAEVPGVERVSGMFKGFSGDLATGENNYSFQGYYTDEEFLRIFSFPVLQGDPKSALKEPYSIVLTQTLAEKIYGSTDVLGQTLERNGKEYTITAVLKELPKNTHFHFEALASLSSLRNNEQTTYLFNWSTMWSSYAYVLMQENANMSAFEQSLNQIASQENAKMEQQSIALTYERLNDIFPGDGKYNQVWTVVPKSNVNSMIILALIVIVSACFNYANLSIARSLKRAKEIGVRKVVGAKKSQVFTQFITESVLVSLLALVLAFFLFRLIRPEFLSLNYYISRTTTLELTTTTYICFVLFAIFIGFLAGTTPALIMTRLKPVSIIKGVSNMKIGGGINIRKVLIGIQFILSIGFAVLVSLAYKQYQYALNFDLGYNTEAILNVELQGNDYEIVKAAFSQIPEIESISGSAFLLSTGSTNSDYAKLPEASDSVVVYSMRVTENYTSTLGHQLVAGREITSQLKTKQMIVNEQFVEKFGFKNPEEIIGKTFYYYNDHRMVVGVIKDFHYGTIYNDIQPFAFIQPEENQLYLTNLKLKSADLPATLEKIDDAWSEIDTHHELQASFYSEDIERTYQTLSSSMKTYGLLAIIAIGISLLGLLGMAVYTAESKIKELTIRKVLGAGFYHLVALLSRSYIWILVIASAIGIPIAVYIFKTTIANNIQYTISIGFWELAGGALMVLTVAILTIGSQATKAALTNPAENLRNE